MVRKSGELEIARLPSDMPGLTGNWLLAHPGSRPGAYWTLADAMDLRRCFSFSRKNPSCGCHNWHRPDEDVVLEEYYCRPPPHPRKRGSSVCAAVETCPVDPSDGGRPALAREPVEGLDPFAQAGLIIGHASDGVPLTVQWIEPLRHFAITSAAPHLLAVATARDAQAEKAEAQLGRFGQGWPNLSQRIGRVDAAHLQAAGLDQVVLKLSK